MKQAVDRLRRNAGIPAGTIEAGRDVFLFVGKNPCTSQ
jgi:hypothetical protein